MILLGDVYIITVGLNVLTLRHSEILALLQLFAIEISSLPNKAINSELHYSHVSHNLENLCRNPMSMNMFILL
jgi:hypothetical protein